MPSLINAADDPQESPPPLDNRTASLLNRIQSNPVGTEYAGPQVTIQRGPFDPIVGQGAKGEPMTATQADAFRQWIAKGADVATTAALGMTGEAPGGKGFTAFHGSPYDFNAFDASKIGTGEGAQAFGHGIYLAENEGIARGYRDRLTGSGGLIPGAPTGKQGFAVNGEYPPEGMGGHQAMDTAIDMNGLLNYMHLYNTKPTEMGYDFRPSYQGSMDYLRSQIERRVDAHRQEVGQGEPRGIAQQDMHALANYYDANVRNAQPADVTPRPPGRMYEVQVNADPAHFLDWDKPLSEQSPRVQALFPVANDGRAVLPNGERADPATLRGESLYRSLAEAQGGSHVDASQRLRDAGIPGIRYLDQGSRAAGEGTSNHVIFDAATMEILRKYGLAGLMAGGAGAVAQQAPREQQ